MLKSGTERCNLVVSAHFVSVFVHVLVIKSDLAQSSVGIYLVSVFYLLELHLLSVARFELETVRLFCHYFVGVRGTSHARLVIFKLVYFHKVLSLGQLGGLRIFLLLLQ